MGPENGRGLSRGRPGPSDRTGKARRRSARLVSAVLVSVVALAVALAVALSLWPRVDAQARAVVVLASVIEAPVATPVVEAATGEPRVEETSVAGNPTSIFHPAGEGSHPAVVFVNGPIPQGRTFEGVRDLATGLARAGYLVVVPDLPGLTDQTVTARAVSETAEAAREVSGWPDVRGGRVGLVGVSTGATLALLAAGEPDARGRISMVVGVAPYADIKTVLSVATTAHHEEGGEMVPYEPDPYMSYVVARSLISALPPGPDRSALLSEVDAAERRGADPLRELRDRPAEDLGPPARSVHALLANEDPERFAALYRDLPPGIRAEMEQLSPAVGDDRVEAPVEIVSGPRDRYFPLSESRELVRGAPRRNLTVTGVLDHSEVNVSPGTLPDLLDLNGFVVRSLRGLRETSPGG